MTYQRADATGYIANTDTVLFAAQSALSLSLTVGSGGNLHGIWTVQVLSSLGA